MKQSVINWAMFKKSAAHLKSKYKLTEDAYRDLLINQYFKCKICEDRGVKLEVDHCHKTGKIRGLLCHRCNVELGKFELGKKYKSHLTDPVKEFTAYLSSKVHIVSRYERAGMRRRNAYRYRF